MLGVSIKFLVKSLTMRLAQLTIQPTLRRRIIDAQKNDPYLNKVLEQQEANRPEGFFMSTE